MAAGVMSFQQRVNKLTSMRWICLVHLMKTENMDLSTMINLATMYIQPHTYNTLIHPGHMHTFAT